jgi:uncharacterized protein (DUF1499 family)
MSEASSRTARVAQWLGLSAPVLTIAGVGLSQAGLPAMVGFRLFTLAILLGLVALVVGIVGVVLTRGGVGGRGQALTGIACGVLMIAIVGIGGSPGAGLPAINDITTNLQDPPAFTPRSSGPNAGRDMSYPQDWVALVEVAYPDLEPIQLDIGPDAAYAAALAQAKAMGWKITREDAAARQLEAEDSTALFRFVDDVSVRVRADGSGSVVDVRSKSRDGKGDVGKNAARIRAFRDGLNARV